MADCEDSLSPTWDNVIDGQINLRDAVRRTIELASPEGKHYRLNEQTAVLHGAAARLAPRREAPARRRRAGPGAFFDFGLYLLPQRAGAAARAAPARISTCRSSRAISRRACGRKCSRFAESALGMPHGTIKATVLIETILAAFEMDEILYELKDYIVGLNCGRWDYIFSFIKKFARRPDFVLPDRAPGDDDHALPALVFAAGASRPATAAAPSRWAAWPRRSRSRTTRPPTRRRSAKVRADKEREATRRARRHLGRASGPGADRAGDLRPPHAGAEPAAPAARGRARRRRRIC